MLLTAPLLAAAILTVWWTMGAPVIFVQERAGRGGRVFRLFKLRTMTNTADNRGKLLPDAARSHAVGALLRRFSLDELPQLWNVLKGDMSLVGPRPLVARYLPRYTPFQMRRHSLRPGITGWAQVIGRNNLSWEDKFALDVWYVDHWTLALDFKILLRTIWKVGSAEDTLRGGRFTEREFTGPEGPRLRSGSA